ncbi:MAG: DUF167 domain-containing protein [Micrococcales bacterium]
MRIIVQVKPGSKKGPLVETKKDGSLLVYLREPAVDGSANEGLVKVLAEHFSIRKADVQIESGFASRIKRVRID